MEITLDEAIRHAEEVAEENQRVVDTGIVFGDVTIDTLYCDDTEVIEEHLANYQRCAQEHRQLAAWLKELKQLKEQESVLNKIRAEIDQYLFQNEFGLEYRKEVSQIIDKYKAEGGDKEENADSD